MTYSHEDSTQKNAVIFKTHTYCMGNMWKDNNEKGHMDLTSCKKIRNKYGTNGQTTYGGNNWKGPTLGKTSKEKIVYGHKKIIGNDIKAYRAQA
eukprot:5302014-Heterocapsa_arctica.AAC.1